MSVSNNSLSFSATSVFFIKKKRSSALKKKIELIFSHNARYPIEHDEGG